MSTESDSPQQTSSQRIRLYLSLKLDYFKPQIRLLDILPGQPDEELHCLGRIVSLDDKPIYSALSYVWGDNQDKRQLTVNDIQINVTMSLAAALRRIRLTDEPIAIWADAVCINQDDEGEKAHQINLMQRIYSECASCFAWMGDISVNENTGTAAFTAARAAMNAIRICAGEPHDESIGWPGQQPVAVSPNGKGITAGAALQSMMDCAWWQRIWTVQEVCLPSEVTILWGPLDIAFNTLIQAAYNMLSRDKRPEPNDVFDLFRTGTTNFPPNHTGPFSIPVISISQAKRWQNDRVDLLVRLWRFRDRKATHPKDKLFGLWGLLEKGSLPSVKPSDYTLDIVTLFTRTTVDLLRSLGSLKALIGWRGESVSPGLPTWVLDLVQLDPAECASDFWTHAIAWNHFDASHGLPTFELQRKPGDDSSFLTLGGVAVDQVARIVMDLRNSEVSTWRDIHEKATVGSANRERTLYEFDNFVQGKLDEHHQHVSDGGWWEDRWWKDRMLRFQVIFVTQNDRIGVGPPNLKPGDEVWILSGGNHPFLLRADTERGNDTKTWEFLGDCFVYGIMYGEAIGGRKLDLQLPAVTLR